MHVVKTEYGDAVVCKEGETPMWSFRPLPKAALYKALSQAQAEMSKAQKSGVNTHRKSKYAKMVDLQEVATHVLGKFGLCVIQYPKSTQDGTFIVTILAHESGEEVISEFKIHPQDPSDMQETGKIITYATRIAYKNMVGVAIDEEDDDGESTAKDVKDDTKWDKYPVKDWHIKDLKKAFNEFENAVELEKDYLAHYNVKAISELKLFQQKEIIAALKDQ